MYSFIYLLFLSCHNVARVWLGLGTYTTWLGYENIRLRLKLSVSFTTNLARKCPEDSLKLLNGDVGNAVFPRQNSPGVSLLHMQTGGLELPSLAWHLPIWKSSSEHDMAFFFLLMRVTAKTVNGLLGLLVFPFKSFWCWCSFWMVRWTSQLWFVWFVDTRRGILLLLFENCRKGPLSWWLILVSVTCSDKQMCFLWLLHRHLNTFDVKQQQLDVC